MSSNFLNFIQSRNSQISCVTRPIHPTGVYWGDQYRSSWYQRELGGDCYIIVKGPPKYHKDEREVLDFHDMINSKYHMQTIVVERGSDVVMRQAVGVSPLV